MFHSEINEILLNFDETLLDVLLVGWTSECLQDWGMFFKLAIFGMLMICIEWWAFEVGVFLTGTYSGY